MCIRDRHVERELPQPQPEPPLLDDARGRAQLAHDVERRRADPHQPQRREGTARRRDRRDGHVQGCRRVREQSAPPAPDLERVVE
eukprot:5212360-Prymnesium_polylepis.2